MKAQGISGTVILAAGGLCPLIHVPVLGNWNYFGIDTYLASFFYFLVVLALLGSLTGKARLLKFAGWAALALVAFTLMAVYFKTHHYFSFLPIKKLVNLAAGMVKYKWGWFVIIAGSLLCITVKRPVAKF